MSWLFLAENESLPNNPPAGFKAFRLNGVTPAFTDSAGITRDISTFNTADIETIIGASILGGSRLSTNYNSGTGKTTLDVIQNALALSSAQITDTNTANGLVKLDGSSLIPAILLPGFVDDILEFASLAVFPVVGESGKIYIALDTSRQYRWSGTVYTPILSGGVDAFNGRTGLVIPALNDYSSALIENTPSGNITANTVQAALNELDTLKQAKLLTGYTIATAISALSATDTVLQALGKLDYKNGQNFKNTGALVNSSNVTLTNIPALTVQCIAGKTYRGTVVGVFRSAAAATGFAFGLAAAGGIAGTLTGTVQTISTAPASNAIFAGALNAFGAVVISPTVPVLNTDYRAVINYEFVCTTSGQIIPTFRSEVNGTTVTLQAQSWIEQKEII